MKKQKIKEKQKQKTSFSFCEWDIMKVVYKSMEWNGIIRTGLFHVLIFLNCRIWFRIYNRTLSTSQLNSY